MISYLGKVSMLLFVGATLVCSSRHAPAQDPTKQTQANSRKAMADPNPSFEVATVKPTDPEHPGRYFRVAGRTYFAHDTSLADLIDLCYGVHPSQIVGAPGWVRTEKFDLQGIQPGTDEPSGMQWLAMIRNLLTERFGLTLHREQRDLPSYVLSVAKGGPRNLTPIQRMSPYPSLEFNRAANGITLPAKNAALSQFCQMMQQVVLDRPVVDRTGIAGTFDFQLTFMPNESQFDGHPPITSSQITTEPAPDLFEALRAQLGLKLEAEKVQTSVLIIDHVDRPAPN